MTIDKMTYLANEQYKYDTVVRHVYI